MIFDSIHSSIQLQKVSEEENQHHGLFMVFFFFFSEHFFRRIERQTFLPQQC